MKPPSNHSIKKSESSHHDTEENPIVGDCGVEEYPGLPFPIVGVGASAGGLEAFSALLKHLPKDTGMAFILVQHLSPTHKSMLSELLGKKSVMPVVEVSEGLLVTPNHVYVIPPNTAMSISNGVLHLDPRLSGLQQNLPIDSFLLSLAEHQKHKAIAVILSGTASDGSLGIKAIKDNGGVTFAQDETTAQFGMMPKNAITTGYIDFVLSPEGIAQELINLSRHPYIIQGETKVEEFVSDAENLPQILMLLQKQSGIDFRNYKPPTLKRRILRRMMLNKIENFKNYVTFLIQNPKEVQILSQDIFITVTRFFRDPEIFEALKHDVFPHLVNGSPESIRVWVLGCSTGEEAYSLAISYLEFLEGKENGRIQLFATDIKDPSIVHARLGIYPENIVNDVSAERLKKFFTKVDKGYQVNKSIRDMCVFARQNVTIDPPFSKLNLISCRNLLIYLNMTSQKKIMPIFHYALKPKGFLLLGQSESVGSFSNLFNVVNKKAKIYSKNSAQRTPQLILGSAPAMSSEIASLKPALQILSSSVTDIQREADRVILKRQHHSGVVVNEAMEVIQFRGDTSRYLKHLPGTASFSLLKMVQEGLFLELRDAIQKVTEENIPYKTKSIRIKHNDGHIDVSLQIIPFKVQPKNERYFLITFEELVSSASPEILTKSEVKIGEVKAPESPWEDSRMRDLEQELESTRLHLEGTIDAKEAANEELQAANEEILSTNEELQSLNEEFQSANEELESAKEELQATNEEITTLNDELQSRNTELTSLNDDHINLMNSTSLPIIIVGRDLKIRRFTPTAEKVFRLIPSDIGRPISDLNSNMDLQDLEVLMLQVMNTDNFKEQEIKDQKGRWHKIQIRPYKASHNKIDGAVITFFDVSDLKKSQAYREAVVQTIQNPLLVLNSNFHIKFANRAFYETFKVSAEQTQDQLIYNLGDGQWNIQNLKILFEEILPKQKSINDYAVEHNFPLIGQKIMLLNARKIRAETAAAAAEEELILLTIEDITIRRQGEKATALLGAIVDSSKIAIISMDLNGIMTSWNKSAERLFGYTSQEAIGQATRILLPPDKQKEETEIFKRLRRGENVDHHETIRVRKDGSLFDVSLVISPIKEAGHVVGASKIIQDITDRKRIEKAIRQSEEGARAALLEIQATYDQSPIGMLQLDTELRYVRINEQLAMMNGLPAADHIGKTIHEVVPDLARKVEAGFRRVLETGQPVIGMEIKGKTVADPGVEHTWLESWFPHRNVAGEIIGINVVAQDITERKRAEVEIKHYGEELLRSNKDLEQFASIASHDLQEPLKIVSSYTELLKKKYKDKFDEQGHQFTEYIVESVSRMQVLIRDLLSYSQVGREHKLKKVDMSAVCNQAVKNLAVIIKESGAKVTCDKLPRMIVDETLITQLFQNLISNAIKFRNLKIPSKVNISAKDEEDDWVFSIKDNGIGIAPEHHDQIFEIFKRLHNQSEYPGTGIGLALCKRIVKFHDGKIWVESESGRGTTFYISLPQERKKERKKERYR